jgi:hypothetical protein
MRRPRPSRTVLTPFPEGDEPIDLNMIRRRDAWASPPELKAAGERSTADGE